MLKKLHLLAVFITACLIAVVINSCKKDLHTDPPNTVSDPAIAQAKSWYESTYPSGTGKLNTQSTVTNFDFSQVIKPDWGHVAAYIRFGDNVIEMPLDAAASAKIALGLKNEKGDQAYDPALSRSSFLLIKQLGKYNAYIMTVIADAAYLKGDLSKLDHNKYNKRDSDFSGVVLYSTPKGAFVSGWTYKNGFITGKISTDSNPAGTTQNGSQATQGLKTNTNAQKVTVCTEWYQTVSFNGITYPSTYLGETCVTFTTGGGGDGSGGGTGSGGGSVGGGGSNGSTSSPSTSCVLGLNNIGSQGKTTVNSLKTQTLATPIGGFPPPTGNPCPTTNVTTIDKKTPNFGMDDNCLNCRVPESRFNDLLDYAKSIGCDIIGPFKTVATIDGVQYPGFGTLIFNADKSLAASYFTPDVSSDRCQIGIEYTIGNKGPNGDNSTGYNRPDASEFNPAFQNGPSATGEHVTYTPPHDANGNVVTPSQFQALITANNNYILNLMQQEDAKDDVAMSPCHGTARNGNFKWPGTAEHWLIQYDYMFSNPLAMREYFIPGSSSKLTGAAGYADIVDPLTNQMFEIKPDNTAGQTAGAAEVQLYVTQGNLLCPPPNGGIWAAGGNYATRYLPDPRNSSNLLQARLFSKGVIVYASVARNNQPAPEPVILPQNLTDKLKILFQRIKANPDNREQLVIAFVRQNPKIIPYLKGASAGVVIASLLDDLDGFGILDDWESFLIARTLWRVADAVVIL
ncbi:hypothetical protein AB6735_16360 [Mucilaginibacter sp. RCC_168]|uniref:hypothetical protein n=1 Tax=Mucilaginibacter sp. RCC_168 TaxID=3239221 RepID=UPI003525763A